MAAGDSLPTRIVPGLNGVGYVALRNHPAFLTARFEAGKCVLE
jgi:hypothetical protein